MLALNLCIRRYSKKLLGQHIKPGKRPDYDRLSENLCSLQALFSVISNAQE